jgi:protein involved in polysaccharide export with SLBB domain
VYGRSFFEQARDAVRLRRANGAGTQVPLDALEGSIGPDQMAGARVGGVVPERYQLGSGDSLTIRVSSPVIEPRVVTARIDATGSVLVPETGRRIVARGQTLAQFEAQLRAEVRRGLRDAEVSVQLAELRSVPIVIMGEAFAPGTYQMPAVVTLFNALYAAGGPGDNGTFRRIQLRRNGLPTRTIDLYRLLINGDARQDVPLQSGDIIMIPPADRMVTVRGEVKRPAIYELVAGERLRDALRYAGGARPTGVTQRVAVESVRPGIERRLIDADLVRNSENDNPVLYDGDAVEIFSIRDVVANTVRVEGAVDQPRTFAYAKGMTVSKLLEAARGTLPDASLERADLFRFNPDGSYTLIPVSLGLAAKRDPRYDVAIQPNDRLVVYRLSDVQWMGSRSVSVVGSVRRPGSFYRANGMTLRDLLIQAGGLSPEAYDQVAFLQRTNPDGTPGPLVRVNLAKLAAGNTQENVVLTDRDTLRVQSITEFQAVPEQQVELTGAFQRPGRYGLSSNMTVKDAVELAGNFALEAAPERAFLQRTNADGTPGPLITVDLTKAIANDPAHNLPLQPRDRLTVYTVAEAGFMPTQRVEIVGDVQRPGIFTRASNMTVRDLLTLAGGPLPTAERGKAYLQRVNQNGTMGPLSVIDLDKAMAGDPAHNLTLNPSDKLSVFSITETQFRVAETVTIRGAVQRPEIYPRSSNMRLRDLISLAGGILPNAAEELEIGRAWAPRGTPYERIRVMDVITQDSSNVELKPGDVVTVPQRSDMRAQPRLVTILGAVQYPGPYMLTGEQDHVSDLVKRAGGFTPRAFPRGAEFVRNPELLSTPLQKRLQPELSETLRLVSDDEYRRAYALADLDRLRIVFSSGASISSSGQIVVPTGGGIGSTTSRDFQPGQSLDQALAQALRSEAVTRARELKERDLIPAGNLNVELAKAVKRPGSQEDVVLADGDVIIVPEEPTTVSVTGAVVRPSSVLFVPGKPLSYYIDRSGGVTNDAALESIVIVRATGALQRYHKGVKVELGDNILVPTKVMATRLQEKQNVLSQLTNTVTSAGLTYAVIRSLLK